MIAPIQFRLSRCRQFCAQLFFRHDAIGRTVPFAICRTNAKFQSVGVLAAFGDVQPRNLCGSSSLSSITPSLRGRRFGFVRLGHNLRNRRQNVRIVHEHLRRLSAWRRSSIPLPSATFQSFQLHGEAVAFQVADKTSQGAGDDAICPGVGVIRHENRFRPQPSVSAAAFCQALTPGKPMVRTPLSFVATSAFSPFRDADADVSPSKSGTWTGVRGRVRRAMALAGQPVVLPAVAGRVGANEQGDDSFFNVANWNQQSA